MPCVHIAGTNGKGSTAAMLESILRAAGLRTGLYTSPHLERINERIRINGEDISDEDFAAAWTRVHASIESLLASGKLAAHPTYFECITAMAFVAFAESGVAFAVYEVGLGGRLDSTNIVVPEVAVITSIDFDHENFLGHSIEEIAGEKAGIIKPGVPVVSSAERPEAREVIAQRCSELGARLVEVDAAWKVEETRRIGRLLPGRCDRPGFADEDRARASASPAAFRSATRSPPPPLHGFWPNADFPSRTTPSNAVFAPFAGPGGSNGSAERPAVYLDGTHNPAGAKELLKFWKENFAGRRIFLVYGAMRDKAVDEIAGLLFPAADFVILTEPLQPRAISAPLLAEMTAHLANGLDRRSRSRRGPRTRHPNGVPGRRSVRDRFALPRRRSAGYWHRRTASPSLARLLLQIVRSKVLTCFCKSDRISPKFG